MGQFDLETDAVLKQLDFEELSKIPGGEFAEIIGDLLALIGTGGLVAVTSGTAKLLLKIRRLAGASYASNLTFAITAVRNDLKDLYREHAELRARIDSLRSDPKFAEAIAALALRAMHTSVKSRLNRLAWIVVNGVKENDLEAESLDDMLRAAVELTDHDLKILGLIYEMQIDMFSPSSLRWDYATRVNNIRSAWTEWWNENRSKYQGTKGMAFNSSCIRLQATGLIASIGPQSVPLGFSINDYELLTEGRRFYERLQEIAAQ